MENQIKVGFLRELNTLDLAVSKAAGDLLELGVDRNTDLNLEYAKIEAKQSGFSSRVRAAVVRYIEARNALKEFNEKLETVVSVTGGE